MSSFKKYRLKNSRFGLKSFALIALFVSLTGYATEQQIQQQVDAFIQNQYKDHFPELVSDDEVGRLKRFYEHIDGRVSIFWTYQSGNVWLEKLTLIEVQNDGYSELLSISFNGVVESTKKVGEELVIQLRTYDENDPRCCPSKKTTLRYRIYNGELIKL
ncbi:hypothetical protein [uncultured Pseudoalteromonas sp.]|uniref:hypothetical protein n=1 Tax=uncultured Pseudoalteromonas sp. TaxID=114053 RepID=UPI002610E536|nr:hypothetical protein [uncultured Pseudoalteromonas sp.]